MILTTKPVNPCRNLRGHAVLLLGTFLRSDAKQFDGRLLDALLEPLPENVKHDLRRDFLAIVEVWRNLKVYGKKCSNTSINRRLGRLDLALFKAEFDFGKKWDLENSVGGAR